MTTRGVLVSASLLLAWCGMAAAQTAQGSVQAPVAAQPAATPTAAETVAKAAAGPSSAAPATATMAPAQKLSAEQRQLLESADKLVSLAEDLETEVGKASEFTLSLKTLARAADIEKLAGNLQKQMQQTQK